MDKIKVVLIIEGGVAQGAYTDHPSNVEVFLVDVDDLEAEGKKRSERYDALDEAIEGLTEILIQ